jgi:CubicO group peptidase (beta-lactamase class C family)
MLRWLAVTLLVSGAAIAQPPGLRRLDGSAISIAEAEQFANTTLAASGVTGAQLAVINDGKMVWKAAFGMRRLDPALPMETNTNTWAASITKAVFGTFVAGHGGIQLDVPVATQLSGPLNSFAPYQQTGAALIRDPRWRRVTPRMLLSHSAGLANFATMEPDKKMHLHFEPGTAYRYSGEGFNLLQFLVEQKTGRPLEELMQETVFGPLEMRSTGLIYRAEFAGNVADRFGADGKFLSQTRRFPARAAGSMTTTVEDLGRYLEWLLQSPVLAEVTKPAVRIRTLHQFPSAPNEPEGEEAKRVGLAYGLGWGLLTKTPFGPAFFKEGHGDGAQTYLICFTQSQTCMILLTNSDNGERAFRPLLEKIMGNTVTPWEWEGYLFAK